MGVGCDNDDRAEVGRILNDQHNYYNVLKVRSFVQHLPSPSARVARIPRGCRRSVDGDARSDRYAALAHEPHQPSALQAVP